MIAILRAYIREKGIWVPLTAGLFCVAFVYLFIQNFVFSSSPDLVFFREFDDDGFHNIIRVFHEHIQHGNFKPLLKINDYWYGWIFWFVMVVVTYPAYLLSVSQEMYMPLMVLPRMVSLLFHFGAAYFIYKSLSVYTKDSTTKATGMLLYLTFPVFGYFSLRFGTVAQGAFFASLAFYLTVRHEKLIYRDLRWIALALAACIGTKLSGFLIAPVIGLIMADRFGWKVNIKSVKAAGYFLLWFIPSVAFFSNPLLLLAPFNPGVVSEYVTYVQTPLAWVVGKQSMSGTWNNFIGGITDTTAHLWIFVLLIAMFIGSFIVRVRKKTTRRFDPLYILITLCIGILYTTTRIAIGSWYVAAYFDVFAFLLIFAVLFLDTLRGRGKYILAAILVAGNFLLNYPHIFDNEITEKLEISYNHYFLKRSSPEMQKQLTLQEEIFELVGSPGDDTDGTMYIMRDYEAPYIYTPLRHNVLLSQYHNTFHSVLDKYGGKYDLIVMQKQSSAFFSEEEFETSVHNMPRKEAAQYRDHRAAMLQFLETKQIDDSYYELVLDKDGVLAFLKK